MSIFYSSFWQETVIEHVQTLNPENPRDFIDHYLLEKEKERDNINSIYRDDCKNTKYSILHALCALLAHIDRAVRTSD